MNRIFRLVWNDTLCIWVAVAENARGRGQRSVRSGLLLAPMLAALGMSLPAHAGPPGAVPAPTQLPTGGTLSAGAATIRAATGPGGAVLNIDQSTQRAAINWSTFDVGSAAQVNFNQPSSASATLNRVLDSNPSQIFGKINAPGQVFLSNPNGVLFGKTASVDVGGLTATTHAIGDADFMAGKTTFARNGSTGSVVNEGELRAALGGYIALLAPEVRNAGVVIARMGTVAMASGESIALHFDANHTLAGITVQPSAIKALVENRGAVIAPGGLIILSAQAVDRLQGGVVKNTGRLEATGLSMKNGRIVLEASDRVDNSGSVSANAGSDGSPAGIISVKAPDVVNSGLLTAAASRPNAQGVLVQPAIGGSISFDAATVSQTTGGTIDVSGATGGNVRLQATHDIAVAGRIVATGTGAPAGAGAVMGTGTGTSTGEDPAAAHTEGQGGSIALIAGHGVKLHDAIVDVSGSASGGTVRVEGGGQTPFRDPSTPEPRPTVALLGATELRSTGRRGSGGNVTLTADRVGLFDTSAIDASGAAGGGQVRVGGGYQGQDGSVANASQTIVTRDARIDASATQSGDGGTVVVWSDERTAFGGSITARGGSQSGSGGSVEVSGKQSLDFRGAVNAGADHGKAGTLLLDPRNITVVAASPDALTTVDQFSDTPAVDSQIAASTITAATNLGTAVTLQANNDITVDASITSANPSGNGGALTFRAGRSIILNGSITSDNGNLSFTANDSGADGNRVAATDAIFVNNGLIDAGTTGVVSITMGTKDQSGTISTGQITGFALNIAHNGPTAGAVSGQINLGEVNLLGGLTVTASSPRNIVNVGGNVVVRGTATLSVGTGDVTINNPTTDFNIVALTAGNVSLVDASALRFGTSAVSGTLTVTTAGPLSSTGPVTVTGATSLTANSGGFGFADPYITLSNPLNHFAGGITLSVTGVGDMATGGSATIRDSGALNVVSAVVANDLILTTGGALNIDLATVARDLSVTTTGALTQTGAVTVPRHTVLTAGAANDITLGNANNEFDSVQIVSGKDVTLVDKTGGIAFGYFINDVNTPSRVYGNLVVTAAGDISQRQYATSNVAAITVDGAATFNTNKLNTPVNLYLGPNDPFNGSNPGSANSFAGAVTLARSNGSGFTNIQLRNISSAASVLSGLTSVGALNNVFLRYDNAPALSLPGMTLGGELKVLAPGVLNTAVTPGNTISQTGPIVVAGSTIVAAGSSGDIVLDNAANNFSQFGVANTGARNLTLVDANAVELHAPGYHQAVTGNLNVTAPGGISDLGNDLTVSGTATLNAGSSNILMLQRNVLNILAIPAANNVSLNTWTGVVLGNSTIAGSLTLSSYNGGYTLTQVAGSAVNMSGGGTTTFNTYSGGITLANTDNVFGPIAMLNAGPVNIRENDAITQASAWGVNNTNAVTLTTSNDQAITLSQANYFGNLTLTQVNNGAVSAGAVHVRETADNVNGMTQGSAWTIHGTTKLDSGVYSINLNNANNVFGPLQVTGATGGGAQTVTLYAKNTVSADAVSDVGGTGAWNTGTGVVRLIAYDSTGATAGGGNINLTNTGNVLGDLYLKATNATITENDSITDGVNTSWNAAGNTGWVTTGTTNLVVANPGARAITLDNLTNQIGPIGIATTGSAGTLGSVLITDNTNLTQASAWNIGSAPITLDARNNAITLAASGNVLGAIAITTVNGNPSAVSISEDDAITQASAWALNGVPVTLVAENAKSILLTTASNVLGNLTLTGGAVSITENDAITQGGAWTTTGTTTLNATTNAITLTNASNVLGAIAIAGTPSAVSITENDNITQASAWVQAATPFTLNAGSSDITLSQAANQLGNLTLTAQNATITETDVAGITDGAAWAIPGTTTLTAGSANPIVLNAIPNSNLGTVAIVSASNADIADIDGIVFGASTIAAGGTLTVSAGGAITQTGAISAPSLRLIGNGSAALTNLSNNVTNLAAGFSGGDLAFTNGGNFAVAVLGGTSGITIGARGATLTSVTGTVTGLSLVNAASNALTITTGSALALPAMSIAGPQTYTGSTVSGSGITLTANITGTAAGAITFNNPVTLGADLTVQSSNSAVNFTGTLAGAGNQLVVNAGSGLASFQGAVSGMGSTGDATPALALSSGGATFNGTVGANNGLAVTGPVVFTDNVTLADGNATSVFTGLVTLGKVGGMTLSGYDGIGFNGGALLQNGPATINSNNSTLAFTAATVSGPFGLTLNSGTQTTTGLDRLGANLTSLSVTASGPTIPSAGVSIAGAQTYTATGSSSIALNGNVASTAAGAITFNSPVTLGASATVSSTNSAITFGGTVNGSNDLTVSSGSGAKTFSGVVGGVAALGDATGAAILLQGTGTTTFGESVQARSGISATGAVAFTKNVTLGDGNTGSVFSALVTSGGTTGNSISGFDGVAFNGGLALSGGPVSIASNGSTLAFGGAVSGTQSLTLNALAGGAGTVSGLDQIGFASSLSRLDVTGQTLALPSTGLAVAGPMNFTAAGGITLNGAVGNSSGPATGAVVFTGPVTLATGAIAVTTANAAVSFAGTLNGAQALSVNAGSGTTTFGAAVGGSTPLTSLTTDSGGSTVLNGGSITTSGAQTYNDAVTLASASTLAGADVQFAGTLNGANALTVNASGTTTFGAAVGSITPLAGITTDAAGSTVVNTGSITTSGAQSYNDSVALGANAALAGNGIAFNGTLNGGFALNANAGTGGLQFNGTVGASTPLASIGAVGNTVVAANVTTSGTQAYGAAGGITLGGNLSTVNANLSITGATTLATDVTVTTGAGAGNIAFVGASSTINGAHALTLGAGTGNVVLGGVAGGIVPLTAMTASGQDLTLPGVTTVGDTNQTYAALNNITLTQSRTLNAPITFTADADADGSGSFTLPTGVSLATSNVALTIRAADIDLQGNSTLASGNGLITLTTSGARNIALGGADAAGQMTVSGSELSRITSSGGLDLKTLGNGWVHVNGISAAQSQNITGVLGLKAQGSGGVSFLGVASTFNAVTADATAGSTALAVDLNATNDAITFVTPVTVSGTATVNSGGGNIAFQSTLALDSDLTLATGNGTLSFGGAVGSNRTLTMSLGGGSVSGLGQLQSTLTGLTVNGSAGITLPAFTINGPQVYNTGVVTATGDLGGIGIAFNNIVTVAPAVGTALTLNAGSGTLAFSSPLGFNANNLTLTADEINVAGAVTGTGSLLLQPSSAARNVALGGSGAPIVGLNLTAGEMAWLPIGTLAGLVVGSASGTGTLDVSGVLNVAGTPLRLNGGGGIGQSGGSVTSGALTLFAAGNPITLGNGANAFGAVAIAGTPSSLTLSNSLDITQFGATAWNLGTAAVTLNAGNRDIVLNNGGNTFGTVGLTARNASLTEAAATDLGVSGLTGNLTVSSTGVVTQSGALTVGGNLGVTTSVAAGDVTIDNSGAAASSIGSTLVGGSYSLTATGDAVSQAAGATLQVRGDFTVDAGSIVLGGAGNKIGGTITLPNTSTADIRQAGVITLGNRTDTGNLTVVSERTTLSFISGQVAGNAIVLTDPANNIGGNISVSASPPTIGAGADVQTGINQAAGTTLNVAGVASFTAEASTAGSLGINLSNDGNIFGSLRLSGNTVDIKNSAAGLTTIGNAVATTHLTLNSAGGVAQTGLIATPALDITAAGSVTLANAFNDVATLAVVSGGYPITYVDANGFAVSALNASGANVALTAGAAGNLTQTAPLLNVGALSANAGGAVTLTNAGNTIASLAASTAGNGLQVSDSAGGLTVGATVRSLVGDLTVRTAGDLTLAIGGRLQADAGDVVASTEAAGNFINDSGASALVVGSGRRWLVYSNTPDLVAGPHTVKGDLTSAFRHFGASYGSYAPLAVTESGNGFIYADSNATLTISAVIVGASTHVYGDTPTGVLGYVVSSGLVDSEDNAGNVFSGGTASYSGAIANTMNAGAYAFRYSGGLISNYTLVADNAGAAYSVTPAVLTYTANAAARVYGAADPAFGGTVGGFKLGQTAAVLGGSATWSSPAVVGSNVGAHAVNGSGYSAANYSFAQAAGNTTALTIGKAALTVTATSDAKTYDGVAYSGGAGISFSAFANGEDASVIGGSVAYGGSAQGVRNAGTYAIAASGLSSGNYAFTYVNGALVVGRAALTLSANTVTKTYDGNLAATGTAAAVAGTQLFGSDAVSGGSFAFTNANAGSANKVVTASGVTVADGNGGNNYTVGYANNTTSTINRASLTVASADVTKTYDATLGAAGSAVVVSGTLYRNASNGNAFDALSGGSFSFADANAGTGGKTVSTSGVTINDGNANGNYTLAYADNTTSTINRAVLGFVGTVSNKSYDGNNTATLAGYALTGLVGGQTLGATSTAATFSDRNAGIGKAVAIGGIALIDGSGLAANYSVAPTASAVATIVPKVLAVNATVASKVYDGNTSATLLGFGLTGLVGGETVNGVYTGSASFADKNAASGKAVTITGIALTDGANGGLAANYAVTTNASSNASITPATLNVAGVAAIDRTYDGTLAAQLNTQAAVLTGKIGADDVHIGSATGAFLDKNVGTNKTIVAGSTVLTGSDAVNYTLIQPSGLSANVTPRSLAVSASGIDKVYDATTAATVGLSDNRVAGDVLSASATAAFLDKNVGVGKFVGVSGITLAGVDAGNYSANSSTAAFAAITRAALTVTAAGASKVYDAGTSGTVTLADNRMGSDAFTLSYGSAAFADKNVGTAKALTVGGINVTGADVGNYTFNTTATTTADITPALITQVTGITAANKVYDGTTTASLAGGTLGFTGLLAGDSLSAVATGAVFADKNAGTGKAVTISGLALSGADAGNYLLQTGSVPGSTMSTGNITQAVLIFGATVQNKVYDTTTAATASLSDNRISGDALSVGFASAAFADKNAGLGKTVTVGGIAVSGADAGNYTFNTTASASADITRATLVVNATGIDRVYDAGTGAAVLLADNHLAGDVLNIGYGSALFADKSVGSGKAVAVSGITLSGADAGNYSANTTAATQASISKATLVVGASGIDKVYDTTTAASAILTDNRLGSDVLDITYGSASFADKNAGTAKAVTIAGLTVSGADAGNYDIDSSATLAATATIAKASLVVSAAAQSRVYDASTGAAVTLADNRLGGDSLTLGHGSASFADKNAGIGKTITVGGIVVGGADAGNYTANGAASALADVTPATISAVGGITAASKVYDGTTAATLQSGVQSFTGLLGGDILSAVATSAVFSDKNAGAGKAVTISGLALSGADAGNYVLQTGILPGSMVSTGDISRATLAVGATAQTRTYDTTTGARVTLNDNRVSGDTLNLSYGSAAFADKNAGTGKTVTVSGIAVSGADADNYSVATVATTTGEIAKAVLTVSAVGQQKVYDAATGAVVALADNHLGNDVLNLKYGTATLADKNVGQAKTITVSGITISGADAGNYSVNSGATTTADVTPASLTVGAIGHAKLYDGTNLAAVTLTDNRINGDDIALTSAAPDFTDRAVGTGNIITVSGIRIAGGADKDNYVLANSNTTTSADVTAYVDTWSRVPIVQPLLRPSLPLPAVSLLDLTLPAGFGGGGKLATMDLSLGTQPGASTVVGTANPSSATAAANAGNGAAGRGNASTASAGSGAQPAAAATGVAVDAQSSTNGADVVVNRLASSGNAATVNSASITEPGASTTGSASLAAAASSRATKVESGTDGNASGNAGVSTGNASTLGNAAGNGTGSTTNGTNSSSSPLDSSAGNSSANASDAATISGQRGTPRAANGSGDSARTLEADAGITVSLVRSPTQRVEGMVSVLVPKTMIAGGKGFSFPLPKNVADAAGGGSLRATGLGGEPLPTWLRYASDTQTFTVTSVPAGALPASVLMRDGKKRWTVVITERVGN